MGAGQSNPAGLTPNEKIVVERLCKMQVEDDDGYVEVSNEKTGDEKVVYGPVARQAEGLRLEVLENWKSNILNDPKNR